jgi:hypothetical protein
MPIGQVRVIRPRPGRRQDTFNLAARAKRIHERCGGKVRIFEPITGPNVGTLLQVVETSDWKAYAEYRTKLETDPEYRALLTEIQNNRDPSADIISAEVLEEVSLG